MVKNENKENDEIKEIKKNKENEEYIPLESDGVNKIQLYQKHQIKNLKIIICLLIIIIFILISIIVYHIYKDNNSKKKSKIYFFQNIKKFINKSEINETKIENNIITSLSNISSKNTNITSGQKRKIYVKYMDFWPAFKLEKFDVHKILLEKYEVIESETPDYVIFGQFGGGNSGIENRINCVKLFLTIENRDPNFSKTDYAIGLHYIENGDRYFRKPTETFELTNIKTVYNVIKENNIDISKKNFVHGLYRMEGDL